MKEKKDGKMSKEMEAALAVIAIAVTLGFWLSRIVWFYIEAAQSEVVYWLAVGLIFAFTIAMCLVGVWRERRRMRKNAEAKRVVEEAVRG